jgi:hypothetical protein
MTIARIVTPAKASACDIVVVTAARVRKIALMHNCEQNTKRKNMKNCAGSLLKPLRKYRMMLKHVAIMNFTGISYS